NFSGFSLMIASLLSFFMTISYVSVFPKSIIEFRFFEIKFGNIFPLFRSGDILFLIEMRRNLTCLQKI
ncbi:hypothetical protein DB326_14110, partial [Lacticaseibacillus casei]